MKHTAKTSLQQRASLCNGVPQGARELSGGRVSTACYFWLSHKPCFYKENAVRTWQVLSEYGILVEAVDSVRKSVTQLAILVPCYGRPLLKSRIVLIFLGLEKIYVSIFDLIVFLGFLVKYFHLILHSLIVLI